MSAKNYALRTLTLIVSLVSLALTVIQMVNAADQASLVRFLVCAMIAVCLTLIFLVAHDLKNR